MIEEKKLRFLDYITCDEDGCMNGIKDDAPEEIKREYHEFIKAQEEAKAEGIKL